MTEPCEWPGCDPDRSAYTDYRCLRADDLAELLAMLDEGDLSGDLALTASQREVLRRVRPMLSPLLVQPSAATATPAPLAAARAVVRAIQDEGRDPEFHRAILAQHRREWPTLWDALDRFMAVLEFAGQEVGL